MRSEIERRYLSGEALSASQVTANSEGLRAYDRVIHHDWTQERATKQMTLEGELIIKKVRPVMTEEQERLKRPTDVQIKANKRIV